MKISIFKAGWIPGLVLTLMFAVLILLPSKPLQTLEFKAYDLAARQSTLAADNNIVIVGVDHTSVRDFGRWPFPRSVVARAIDKLTAANAQLVVADFQLENATYSPELSRLADLQVSSMEGREIVQQLRSLNQDQQLINAVQGNGHVLMPLSLRINKKFATDDGDLLPESLDQLRVAGLMNDKMKLLSSGMLGYPFDGLTQAVAGLGFDTVELGRDGVLRGAPLFLRYGDAVLPSLTMVAAATLNNLSMSDIQQDQAATIGLGALSLKVDSQARFFPVLHRGESNVGYRYISFKTLLADNFPLQSLKNKIVLIGLNDGKTEPNYATPLSAAVAPIVFHANMLQSIMEQTYISRPSWFKWLELGLLLLCGAFFMFAFPRLHIAWGGAIAVVVAVLLIATTIILLMFKMIWLQLIGISVFMLFGSVSLVLWRIVTDMPAGGSAESAEQNKMLGLSFQSQGMLDMAFDKLRLCPVNDDILLHLYNLALDFERKRQLDKAGNVYEYILGHNKDYKDTRVRIDRLNSLMEGSASATGSMGSSGIDTLLVAGGTKPTLGRYEIVKVLGKGAMGIVYLGRDPKINRYVAIKTMSLTQEFETDDVDEVKSRFFREAKTAGMLSHPNIVTMYDVGEEHDLAYIAMEYLDGSDLAPYTKKGKLFPPQATLKICGKVAEALHVAHSQSVIHRDIKPANIMLLKDKTVKVTDFGIARISAASKTKSGVVLGTPSYMSPEQLSGKHIDGRSDLFSLGVMMYEMLSGVRPFRGDSMATLMFQIANEPHPDVREHCDAATESTAKLIDRMLAKDPEARIPNGAEVIRGIIQCLRDMNR